jgi:transposase InsO family protein
MQRRDAVLQAMKGHLISQRRACVLIGVDPKTVRRDHPPDNPEIRKEMNKIAEKPQQNGYIESFNGSLRDECLNEEIFDTLADARRILAFWRYDYNNVRPHSSLGNKTR